MITPELLLFLIVKDPKIPRPLRTELLKEIVKNLIIIERKRQRRYIVSPVFDRLFKELEVAIINTKQDDLRQKVRFLKWHDGVAYKDIASSIGMDMNSFYNFISGKKVNISYKMRWRLENYLKEVEEWKNGK